MTAEDPANTHKSPSRQVPAREISDAKTMRALAHPVRLQLLELIHRDGEVTATRAAEALNESPGNMSWHLQTLAKYGFIEEAGGGKGRARPWRITSELSRISTTGADQSTVAAGNALAGLMLDNNLERWRAWLAASDDYSEDWQKAAPTISSMIYLTAPELQQLADQLVELLSSFADRIDPALRPEDALPVELTAFGHPLPQTPSGN
jgi:DNA-binding transcriptional ArsR family regulator